MLPGILISLVSLAVVFYFADPAQLLAALRYANYPLVLLNAVITLSWILVRAQLWRVLLRGRPTYPQSFWTVSEGYLLNNALPLRLGEVGRSLLMSRKTGLTFWQVLSSVLVERLFDIAMALGLLLSTLPFVVGGEWAGKAAPGIGLLVLAGIASLYILARWQDRVIDFYMRVEARLPVLRRFGVTRLQTFLDGIAVLNDGRLFLIACGLLLVNWGVALAQYFILLRAFMPGAQFIWAAFTLGVAAVGAAAPSSPGAVGVYEASVVGALALFGVDQSTSLAFALTAHLLNILITGVLGSIGLAMDGESLTSLYRLLRQTRTAE